MVSDLQYLPLSMREDEQTAESAFRLDIFSAPGAVVVRPGGMLTTLTYSTLRDALLDQAAQEPPALVVDLDGMGARTVTSLAVFPAVQMRIDNWPGVPMVLAAGRFPLRLLESSVVPWFVPTYPGVAEALQAVRTATPRRRREVVLCGGMVSGRRTRAVVEQTCHEWRIPHMVVDAVQVASELVENLVRHARSEGLLRLELRGGRLTIAVDDNDSRPPRICPPTERRDSGRGLVLIAELSRAWGFAPRSQGGKVVWAVLTVPGP